MNKDISQVSTYQSGVMQSAAHRMLTRIKAEYLSHHGLTSTQWFVIGFVYDAGEAGIRLSDLMEILDTSMPFITTTINHLEAKGILNKTSATNDSRVKIARINPAYITTVEEIEAGLRDELRQRLYKDSGITRDELAIYMQVLEKITSPLDEAGAK